MPEVAIIGGTGLTSLKTLRITRREVMHTPYGEPSGPLTYGELCGKEAVFLPRHGAGHTIPPHRVNYRANLWALWQTGVKCVIAVAAVGGIREDLANGQLVFPDQIIDYTWSRGHTFFEDGLKHVTHIDFTHPYCEELRIKLMDGARRADIVFHDGATYAAMQGPRLETAAEIDRLERDGCDIVGMTGMPEAALARELDLCYACCAVVANAAAGRGDGDITMAEIERNLGEGLQRVRDMLERVISQL